MGTEVTKFEQEQADEAQQIKLAVRSDPALKGEYQRQIALREASKMIASTQWGKNLSSAQQAAIAQYALSIGADPVRHITTFGGKPWLEAEFYMEQFALSVPDGSLALEMIDPKSSEAVANGCPDFATACCRASAWRNRNDRHAGMVADAIEYNWAPNSIKRNNSGNLMDSVGTEHPHKTARTRAARRCLRLITPIRSAAVKHLEAELERLQAQGKATVQGGEIKAVVRDDAAVAAPADPYQEEVSGAQPEPQGEEEIGPTFEQRERIDRLLTSGHLTTNEAARINAGLEEGRPEPWWKAALTLYEKVVQDREAAAAERDDRD